jgi:hypothetical protein
MPTLQEQLLDIEKKEVETEDIFLKFRKINRYLSFTNTLRYLFSYLIILVVISLFFYFLRKDFFSWKAAWIIFIFSIYPGFAFISLIADLLEKTFEWLAYKLARIDRTEFYTTALKLNGIKDEKASICKQITIEKVRIQKEINKEIENKFIFKLNDAVYNIENRKINFIEAEQLQRQLEKDYVNLKSGGLYWYTSRYYNNRFEKISNALKAYDTPDIPIQRLISMQKVDNVDTAKERPVVTSNKIIVHPFTANYKPIRNTETPITTADKIVAKGETLKNEAEKLIDNTQEPITTIDKIIANAETPITTANKQEPWWNPEKKEIPTIIPDKLFTKSDITLDITSTNNSPAITNEESLRSLFTTIQKQKTDEEDNIFSPIKKSAEDYVEINRMKQTVGLAGELMVLQHEKQILKSKNREDLAVKVQHVSKDLGDGFGYDIISYDEFGNIKYIEVKTTTKKAAEGFYISDGELKVVGAFNGYHIYRVFNFNAKSNTGSIFKISSLEDFNSYFNTTPTTYKVIPKGQV